MNMSEESNEQDPPEPSDEGPSITVSGANAELQCKLAAAADHALKSLSFSRGRLEIAVVDAEEMAVQHRQWKKLDGPTDVLSFDLRDAEQSGHIDGQLIVCEQVARDEAQRRLVDWQDELTLYVIHGCLHLCGYDDHDPDDAAAMHRKEDQLLTELGRPPIFYSQDTDTASCPPQTSREEGGRG